MLLLDKINDDLKVAQRGNDELSVSTLRFLLSKIDYQRIALGRNLNDDEVRSEISKEAKRHIESITAYKSANRADLFEREEKELAVLQSYLPEPYSEEQLTRMVEEAIRAVDAKSPADMGRVVKAVISSGSGRADGAKVAEIVKQKLTEAR